MPESFGLPLYEGVDWNSNANRYDNVTDTVSLFTREWIEIKFCFCLARRLHCLPLYEGVDWNIFYILLFLSASSLPLYEGVDWNLCSCARLWHRYIVSLFTREWIEILSRSLMPKKKRSLPLYEGVDWNVQEIISWRKMPRSPSLRGSGLKWCNLVTGYTGAYCLPLYEGVDWNWTMGIACKCASCLPLYEGVDWNHRYGWLPAHQQSLPLYEGVDWELVFIAKKWYNRRYEKRISSNKLRKWFDRQTMGSNQRILSIRK